MVKPYQVVLERVAQNVSYVRRKVAEPDEPLASQSAEIEVALGLKTSQHRDGVPCYIKKDLPPSQLRVSRFRTTVCLQSRGLIDANSERARRDEVQGRVRSTNQITSRLASGG